MCPLGLSVVEAAPTNYKCWSTVGSGPSSMERAGVAGTGYCAKGPSRGMVLPTSTPASAACNYAFSNSLALALSSHTDLTSSQLSFLQGEKHYQDSSSPLFAALPAFLTLPTHMRPVTHSNALMAVAHPPTPCLALALTASRGPYEAFHSQVLKHQGANKTP